MGKHDSHYVCRNCLSGCTIQSELVVHERICGIQNKSVNIPCKETDV